MAAALLAATTLIGACSSGADGVPEGETHEYTIPDGTGERIDDGEDVDIVPSRILLHVGDRFVVHNEDDREHVVGPYVIGAGESLEQQYTTPGLLRGLCTVHQSRELEIIVLGPEETAPEDES
ncbi:MAG: hypothetical protein M5T61_07490 [Acidimicrobiia bacterium]|nr:hypothetical protein [Acidimicrobiia bacterium]